MPKAFENCIRSGGKVRTKELSNNRYMHICFKNGKSYAGEVKTKKNSKKTSKQKYAEMLIKGR